MEIDPTTHDHKTVYRTMTTVTAPRPIGWISSVDSAGRDNVAPYSHYNNACASPPVVMFSAGIHDGMLKHTAKNALETEEFVVNLATSELLEQMDATSASLDADESEFDFANLKRAESIHVAVPRIADSPVNLECKLYDSMEVYNNILILGEVVYIHIADELTTAGKIDSKKVDVVGRLGGPYYTDSDSLAFTRKY